jgi:hypothetical protein
MDSDEQKFIAMAMKHLKQGTLSIQAKSKAEIPIHTSEPAPAKEKKARRTKKAEVPASAPAAAPAPVPAPPKQIMDTPKPVSGKKSKRPPTEWNKLVQKHHAMVKGQPDAFQKAIKMAKEERAGTGHVAPELKKAKVSKKKAPEANPEAPSKKKVQLHLTEYEDS